MAIHRLHLVVCAGLAITQAMADVVVERSVTEALASGRARVIVEIDLPGGFTPFGNLSEASARSQTQAIAEAQQSVLSAVAGDDVRLIRRPKTAPFLALEIGPDGLARLVAMPERVARVLEDGTAQTSRPQ